MKTKLLSTALVMLACFTSTHAAWAGPTFQLLHEFNPTNSGPAYPLAGLAQGSDGSFYGTTSSGGTNGDFGTVFKITPGGVLTTLLSFNGTNGSAPAASLLRGNDGHLYGTTTGGGAGYNGTPDSGSGTVFQIVTNDTLTTLALLGGTNGSQPWARLVQGIDGNFYGTTTGGGNFGAGTVFQITPSGTLTTLYKFFSVSPRAGLVQGSNGNFYGTASGGGPNGIVYQFSPGGPVTSLHSFNGADGSEPDASLVQGNDGDFYGTTGYGGTNNLGTVFRITPGGTLTSLFSFNGTNGSVPLADLVQGSDGNFYGTTLEGGPGYNGTPYSGNGTVFQITTNGVLTSLHFFNGTNGSSPVASLVQGNDGNFYGTTFRGGAYDGGTIFRLVQTQPPVITAITSSNGAVTLTWTSFTNGIYRVEYKPTLTATNWTALTPNVTATGSTASKTDNPGSATQRFYRVVLLP